MHGLLGVFLLLLMFPQLDEAEQKNQQLEQEVHNAKLGTGPHVLTLYSTIPHSECVQMALSYSRICQGQMGSERSTRRSSHGWWTQRGT